MQSSKYAIWAETRVITPTADPEARRVRLPNGRIRILPPYGYGDEWSGGIRTWSHG